MRNLYEFAQRYALVLSPSWSPPHSVHLYAIAAQYPAPIFSLISNANDLRIIPRLSPKFVMVPLYASNWVHAELYSPVPYPRKDIDIVMLANFGIYKRHLALFRALRRLPRSLRVVLIGRADSGRTRDTIMREAAAYGVADRIEVRVGVSDEEVAQSLARSRISIILSKREGSCVAVVESLFADTPVGVLDDAEIGSKVFINSATGRLLKEKNLASELMDFLEHAAEYHPRQWALESKIDCYGSTEVLNRYIRDEMLASGQEWTRDIAVHHWRPNPELLFPQDKESMHESCADIEQRFGIAIGPV